MSHINNLLGTITLPPGMLWGKADNTRAHEYREDNYIVYLRKENRVYTFEIPLNSNDNKIIELADKAVQDFTNILNGDA